MKELPISLSSLAWVLLNGDVCEVREHTATYVRDAAGDLNGWIRFEDADDSNGDRIWCLVSAIVAFGERAA